MSLQRKMMILLLGLTWNSSHLNATVNTDCSLEAIDQSLKVVTQEFNDRLTNYEIRKSGCKRKSKLKVRGQHNSYGSFAVWEQGKEDKRKCTMCNYEMKNETILKVINN